MNFKELNLRIQKQFDVMQQYKLFRLEATGQQIWDAYLGGFKPGQNPIFRDPASSEANCNNDKNFIRRYGNVVAITPESKIISMFDIDVEGTTYEDAIKNVQLLISQSKVSEVFFETFDELNSLPYEKCSKTQTKFQLGHEKNHKQYTQEEVDKFGVVNTKDIYVFNHFHVFLNKNFVDVSGKSVESLMGGYRDAKNVFQRAMEEISLDTLNLVRDLINQGSLLDGQTHLYKVEQFIPLKTQYDALSAKERDNWCWINSYNLPFAKFKNELIGVLCSDLSLGLEINKACQDWNKRVDPRNYMKVTAPITTKQIEEARKFVEDNGYVESFDRRFATMNDIKVSEILHSNIGKDGIKTVSIFDGVKATKSQHKKNEFEGVEEVSIDKFMKDILPSCTSVEAYLENRHEGNFVSLTTANIPDSKPIFKWKNNFSWTFNGNLAGKSQIKEAVKTAGGKIDGVLRFSITWNEDGRDILDFDAHTIEPNRTEIYYGSYKGKGNKTSMSGNLDVDMIRPGKLGVENIVWDDQSKMKDGVYKFFIRNYDGGNNQGFKAEVEFNNQIYTYDYCNYVTRDLHIAEVTLKDGEFSIKHLIPATEGVGVNKEIYSLETNQFHKVNLISLSPNHWGDNNIGNKHFFFMLEGCKAPTSIRSFHNENLNDELIQHKRVMEVLGNTNMIETTDKQLSGLGFNSTVKDSVILKLGGNFKRTIKVNFN
jgi:hypothetical protein